MNKKIIKLARKAGFCMWSDETWRPEGAVVDWAAQYDEELELFAMLIVDKAIKKIDKALWKMEHLSNPVDHDITEYDGGQIMGLLYAKEYLDNMFD